MCVVCAAFRPVDPECIYTGLGNTIVEVADAPATTLTPYTISAGDVFQGTLNPLGDRDWVRIELAADQTYEISLRGAPSGGGTLNDPYLRVYDANGVEVTFDDDSGIGLDSFLIISGSSGTFYLEAAAFGDRLIGTYTLSVISPTPLGPYVPGEPVDPETLTQMSAFLTQGYWASTGRGARSWADHEITVNLTGLSAEGQQLARWAMESWEMVADLRFVETSGTADITFQDNESGAFASSTTQGATIVSSTINVSATWLQDYGTTLDSYSFSTYIHEIGHALGLGHQGPYNFSATYGLDNVFDLDSYQMSIMSYFNQNQNTVVNASYALGVTAQMADIHAIQSLYGAAGAGSATAGNTVWGANNTLTNYMGTLFAALAGEIPGAGIFDGGPVMLTIYDVGGHDTLDLSTSTVGNRVDLRPGTWSDVGGLIGNLGIYVDTIIEDVIGGSGNDTLIGNDAANVIWGGAGDDIIYAGSGDTVHGGLGNDTLILSEDAGRTAVWMSVTGTTSFAGVVHFSDGSTLQFYEMTNLPDLPRSLPVAQFFQGTSEAETITGGAGNDTVFAAGGDDFVDMRAGGNNLAYGGNGNDTLYGGSGNDTLGGGVGDDLIDARAGGVNELWAGAGNDTVYGGNNGDRIGGGAGNDLIIAGNGNNEIYGGSGNDTIDGGTANDTIYGGAGSDVINGGAGNDVISAGAGFDVLTGGSGADTFIFYRNFNWNNVMDFNAGEGDTLALAQWLWSAQGTLTAQQVVDQFASINGAGNVVLNFGTANTQIQLMGFDDLAGLADHIDIIA